MEVYARSRGFDQEKGYGWQPAIPPFLNAYRLADFIQSESHSLLLGRYEDCLLLFVTGMEASERKDFRDRLIRNSVVWVAEETTETERRLRSLAVFALRDRNRLSQLVNEAIQPDSNSARGFRVNRDRLRRICGDIAVGEAPPVLETRIAFKSSEATIALAKELATHRLPPWPNRPLAIVTGIKNRETFERAGVWRALSNTVDETTFSLRESCANVKRSLASDRLPGRMRGLFFLLVALMGLAAWLAS